jgi:hypothetical protein
MIRGTCSLKAQRTVGNNTINVEQQKAAALGRGAGTTGRGNGTELPRVEVRLNQLRESPCASEASIQNGVT